MTEYQHSSAPLELPTLLDCLAAAPYRRLFAVMQAHNFECSTRWPKERMVAYLHDRLSSAEYLTTTCQNYDVEMKRVLQSLLAAGGAMSLRVFTEDYGPIPDAPAAEVRDAEFRHGETAAARLWFMGLVHPWQRSEREPSLIMLPQELAKPLQALFGETSIATATGRSCTPGELLHHLALFMAHISETPIRPIKGGWLPPRSLRRLLSRLGRMPAPCFRSSPLVAMPQAEEATTELTFPYLRFLHYLLEYCGLIGIADNVLVVTGYGWQWLEWPAARRYESVLRAWQSPLSPDAGGAGADQGGEATTGARPETEQVQFERRYRQPLAGFSDLVRMRTILAGLLAQLSARRWKSYRHFLRAAEIRLRGLLPWQVYITPLDIHAFFTGPAYWLGLVQTAPRCDSFPAAIRGTRYCRLLTANEPPGESDVRPPVNCRLRHGTIVIIPRRAASLHLVKAVCLGEWLPAPSDRAAARVKLTRNTVARAVARGWTPEQIKAWLESALGKGLSIRLQRLVRRGASDGGALTIRETPLLEADSPERLRRLINHPLLRAYFRRRLSPVCVELDAGRLAELINALQRCELFPRITISASETASIKRWPDAAGLLAAALFYQWAGRLIQQSVRLDPAVIEALKQMLTPMQIEAMVQAAADAAAALRQARHGWTALPPEPFTGGDM